MTIRERPRAHAFSSATSCLAVLIGVVAFPSPAAVQELVAEVRSIFTTVCCPSLARSDLRQGWQSSQPVPGVQQLDALYGSTQVSNVVDVCISSHQSAKLVRLKARCRKVGYRRAALLMLSKRSLATLHC